MTRRTHIDRLELDLRGIPVATAQRAAQLLGPALTQELENRPVPAPGHQGASSIDAGCINSSLGVEPTALATQIARHIASKAFGEKS